MNHIKQLFTLLTVLLTAAVSLHAQDDPVEENKAENWYADRCEAAITFFESANASTGKHPQKYCIIPSQQAAPLNYALIVASYDERALMMLTPSGTNLKSKVVDKTVLPEETYWRNISNFGSYRTHSSDITLCERPLPVRSPSKSNNTFEVVVEGPERIADIKTYNQMIFKPHKNSVRLADQHADKKVDEDGTVVKDDMRYLFKLNTPSVVAKMFRGYEDEEMCPWVVKSSFFNHHTLLQYSRWKNGEPVKQASADAIRIISKFYGGRRIKSTRWLATLETGERTFYAVQFEHQVPDALASLVGVAEGKVAYTCEFEGEAREDFQSIWFVDDEGDFMEHAPEIHCIVATDKGLELYIRLFGGESVQYYILREMGSVLMAIQTDYWIYVWD